MVGSAIQNLLQKPFANDSVKVIGIETSGASSQDIAGFASATGATFPIAMQGQQTAAAYGAGGNYVFLIDRNGYFVDILAAGSSINRDSALQAMADKIPALLASAALLRGGKAGAHASLRQPIFAGAAPAYDLHGRPLSFEAARSAHRPVVLSNGKLKIYLGK
ncbi:MAG: hypothetical protein PHC61_08760 [Chitinivibrionales bacterium]|nr:hypothetical protein [Chitinivibrionales bacterium]